MNRRCSQRLVIQMQGLKVIGRCGVMFLRIFKNCLQSNRLNVIVKIIHNVLRIFCSCRCEDLEMWNNISFDDNCKD